MNNYIHCFNWDVISYSTVKVTVWVSNYIPLIYEYVITYPCPNPDVDLAHIC